METSVTQKKETPEQLDYYLAGHQVPAGDYRDTQTGRELRLEEDSVLPATYDGHVAVYVRLPLNWADLRLHNKEGD